MPLPPPTVSSGGSRRPMDPARVTALLPAGFPFRVTHTVSTGSTNDDLARSGRAGTVLVTEEQTAGRGRAGRAWACPAGAGLMFSVRIALPGVPPARRGWIGAVLGLAVVRAIATVTGLTAGLKWPNDVLIADRKCAGILAELLGDEVVVGAGINVSLRPAELPRPDATSLELAGAAPVDRDRLLAAVLVELAALLEAWLDAAGEVDSIRRAYLRVCRTIGADVRIELPGGQAVTGQAVDVDPDGSIVLVGASGGRRRFAAGDVVHVRPALA